MESLARLLQAALPVAWTAAAAAYLLVFLRGERPADRWCRPLAVGAAAAHTVLLVLVGLSAHTAFTSPAFLISAVGLSVALVHVVLEGRVGSRTTGVFPASIVLVLVVVSSALDLLGPAPDLPRWSTAVHVAGAILAYAGLLLSSLYGTLFLMQQRAMRSRRFGLLWQRLPSLELLDQFSVRSLVAAAIFLTLTIGFGHVVGTAPDLAFAYSDPKIMFTNMIWLGAVLIVVSRRLHWMRPAASAWGAIVLFVVAVGNMLIVDSFSSVHPG